MIYLDLGLIDLHTHSQFRHIRTHTSQKTQNNTNHTQLICGFHTKHTQIRSEYVSYWIDKRIDYLICDLSLDGWITGRIVVHDDYTVPTGDWRNAGGLRCRVYLRVGPMTTGALGGVSLASDVRHVTSCTLIFW